MTTVTLHCPSTHVFTVKSFCQPKQYYRNMFHLSSASRWISAITTADVAKKWSPASVHTLADAENERCILHHQNHQTDEFHYLNCMRQKSGIFSYHIPVSIGTNASVKTYWKCKTGYNVLWGSEHWQTPSYMNVFHFFECSHYHQLKTHLNRRMFA